MLSYCIETVYGSSIKKNVLIGRSDYRQPYVLDWTAYSIAIIRNCNHLLPSTPWLYYIGSFLLLLTVLCTASMLLDFGLAAEIMKQGLGIGSFLTLYLSLSICLLKMTTYCNYVLHFLDSGKFFLHMVVCLLTSLFLGFT